MTDQKQDEGVQRKQEENVLKVINCKQTNMTNTNTTENKLTCKYSCIKFKCKL